MLSLAKCKVLCRLGLFLWGGGGGGAWVKEEVEVWGSAGTKGKSGQVLRVSVGAGHDRSSVRIAATRREPREASSRHGTQDGDVLVARPHRGSAVHGKASQAQRK